MPSTNAEMTAWNLGQEWAANPDKVPQAPNQPWDDTLIPMTDERIRALEALGVEHFIDWVTRGRDHFAVTLGPPPQPGS